MSVIHNCPFCNHEDVQIDEVDLHEFAIVCPECLATGPIHAEVMLAIAAWNMAGTGPRKPPNVHIVTPQSPEVRP